MKTAYFTNCTTAEEIKKEFRRLSLELHPDRNNGNDEEFKKMLNEYESRMKGAGAWTKTEAENVAAFRAGCVVFFFGAGMSSSKFFARSISGDRVELVRLHDTAAQGLDDVEFCDEWTPEEITTRSASDFRPLSRKFGIGYYWDDIDGETIAENERAEYISRAESWKHWREEAARIKAEAEEQAKRERLAKERAIIAEWADILEELPANPTHRDGESWQDFRKRERKVNAQRLAAFKRNIKAAFAHYFPGVRVNVKNSSRGYYENSVIEWTDGPTVAEVQALDIWAYFCGWSWHCDEFCDYGHRQSREDFAEWRNKFGAFADEEVKFSRSFSEGVRAAAAEKVAEIFPEFPARKFNDTIPTSDDQARRFIDFLGLAERTPFAYSEDLTEEQKHEYFEAKREHDDDRRRIYNAMAPSWGRCFDGLTYWQTISEYLEEFYNIPAEKKNESKKAKAETTDTTEAPADGLTLEEIPGGVAVTGDTYPHRRAIKAHGMKWNKAANRWEATGDNADNVRAWFALRDNADTTANDTDTTTEEPATAEPEPTEDTTEDTADTITRDDVAEAAAAARLLLLQNAAKRADALTEENQHTDAARAEVRALLDITGDADDRRELLDILDVFDGIDTACHFYGYLSPADANLRHWAIIRGQRIAARRLTVEEFATLYALRQEHAAQRVAELLKAETANDAHDTTTSSETPAEGPETATTGDNTATTAETPTDGPTASPELLDAVARALEAFALLTDAVRHAADIADHLDAQPVPRVTLDSWAQYRAEGAKTLRQIFAELCACLACMVPDYAHDFDALGAHFWSADTDPDSDRVRNFADLIRRATDSPALGDFVEALAA